MAEESHLISQAAFANPSAFQPSVDAQHVAILVQLKLTRTNYFLWKSLLIPVLKKYDMFNIVEGIEQPPPQFLVDKKGKISTIEDPASTNWIMKDQTCMICINATLSETVLHYTAGCTSARALWLNLEKRIATTAQCHAVYLKSRFRNLKKGMMSMGKYLELAKEIADDLAAASSPLEDCDFVGHVLKGLPSDYDDFVTSINARYKVVTPEELHDLLLSEEVNRKTESCIVYLSFGIGVYVGLRLARMLGAARPNS